MKRLLSIILACALLLGGCASTVSQTATEPAEDGMVDAHIESEAVAEQQKDEDELTSVPVVEVPPVETMPSTSASVLEIPVKGLDDAVLLQYVEDNVYSLLIQQLNSEDYFIENVEAIYYPKEYIEALAFNSQSNRYFGYTVDELNEQFQGGKYVFTLGADGQTIVVPMETVNEDIYVKAMEDVLIGTGVILICVTVSVVAAPAAPAVGMIFAASASTGIAFALESGVISFAAAAIAKGYETESFDQAIKAGVEAGGEAFKWGAIIGVTVGGAKEAIALKGATLNGLSMKEVASIQQESGYPLSIIKQFHSVKEYTVFKDAGLQAEMVGGKLALVRPDIDLYNAVDEYGRNNLTRLSQGLNPIDAAGKTFEWHHIGQNNNATLALLTSTEHDAGALHGFKVVSEIDRKGFKIYKEEVLNKDLLRWLLTIVE